MGNGETLDYTLGRMAEAMAGTKEELGKITVRLDEGAGTMKELAAGQNENTAAITEIKKSVNGGGYTTVKLPFLGWPVRMKKDRVGLYAVLCVGAIIVAYPLLKASGIIDSGLLTREDVQAMAQGHGTTNVVIQFSPK